MKKAYETPKAEQMAFNYSENVVASSCGSGIWKHYVDTEPDPGKTTCSTRYVEEANPHMNN